MVAFGSRRATTPKQVTVLVDRTRKRTNPDELAVDLCYLCDRANVSGSDNDPGTLADELRLTRVAEERPRQPGVVLSVQVDAKIERFGHDVAFLVIHSTGSPVQLAHKR